MNSASITEQGEVFAVAWRIYQFVYVCWEHTSCVVLDPSWRI